MGNSTEDSIILITDPRILAVRIQDHHEPMVDLKDQSIILLGPSPEIPNNTDYTHLRKSVYQKLIAAQKLLPQGLHFCLYEGYRSLALQKKLFEGRYVSVKNKCPNWPHDRIFIETTRLVSPVINLDGSKNVPPHCSGAAIDVYLVDDNHRPLDMGIHPKDWMKDIEGTLSLTASTHISAEAQKNRALMGKALKSSGFVNYPTEYWHWSYGDRYWAYIEDKPMAIYGCYDGP